MINFDNLLAEPASFNPKEEITAAKEYLSLIPEVDRVVLVGSAAWMEDPADVDFIILGKAEGDDVNIFLKLLSEGWENCDKIGQYEMDGNWFAIRKGHINLLITVDEGWMNRMIQATEVCKYLRLTEKKDRIAVNQIIRDGKTADHFLEGPF